MAPNTMTTTTTTTTSTATSVKPLVPANAFCLEVNSFVKTFLDITDALLKQSAATGPVATASQRNPTTKTRGAQVKEIKKAQDEIQRRARDVRRKAVELAEAHGATVAVTTQLLTTVSATPNADKCEEPKSDSHVSESENDSTSAIHANTQQKEPVDSVATAMSAATARVPRDLSQSRLENARPQPQASNHKMQPRQLTPAAPLVEMSPRGSTTTRKASNAESTTRARPVPTRPAAIAPRPSQQQRPAPALAPRAARRQSTGEVQPVVRPRTPRRASLEPQPKPQQVSHARQSQKNTMSPINAKSKQVAPVNNVTATVPAVTARVPSGLRQWRQEHVHLQQPTAVPAKRKTDKPVVRGTDTKGKKQDQERAGESAYVLAVEETTTGRRKLGSASETTCPGSEKPAQSPTQSTSGEDRGSGTDSDSTPVSTPHAKADVDWVFAVAQHQDFSEKEALLASLRQELHEERTHWRAHLEGGDEGAATATTDMALQEATQLKAQPTQRQPVSPPAQVSPRASATSRRAPSAAAPTPRARPAAVAPRPASPVAPRRQSTGEGQPVGRSRGVRRASLDAQGPQPKPRQ